MRKLFTQPSLTAHFSGFFEIWLSQYQQSLIVRCTFMYALQHCTKQNGKLQSQTALNGRGQQNDGFCFGHWWRDVSIDFCTSSSQQHNHRARSTKPWNWIKLLRSHLPVLCPLAMSHVDNDDDVNDAEFTYIRYQHFVCQSKGSANNNFCNSKGKSNFSPSTLILRFYSQFIVNSNTKYTATHSHSLIAR